MRNRFINIALLLVLSLPALEATSQTVPTEVKNPKKVLPEICDHVPKKDDVGVLYPEENAACYSEKNEPLYGNCYDFYYFKTVRKIKIENFCLIIKVGDYKFNEIDDSKLDKFEVF